MIKALKEQEEQYKSPDFSGSAFLHNINKCIDLYLRVKPFAAQLKKTFKYIPMTIVIDGKRLSQKNLEKHCVGLLRKINYSLTIDTAEEFEPFYKFLLKRIPSVMNFKLGYHPLLIIPPPIDEFYKNIQYLQTFITLSEQQFIWKILQENTSNIMDVIHIAKDEFVKLLDFGYTLFDNTECLVQWQELDLEEYKEIMDKKIDNFLFQS
jgi:hypothetical protein